jgi:hypothetical protein
MQMMSMVMLQVWVQMRMVVVMIGQLHRDAGNFDFDVGEARSTWATMNADELLYTRRV